MANRAVRLMLVAAAVTARNLSGGPVLAVEFSFPTVPREVDSLSTGSLTVAELTLELQAGPASAGAVLREFSAGLGIQSRTVAGVFDPNLDKFDVLLDVLGTDTLTFSFDKPGVLTGIDFDGVKDEPLEFFTLESTNGLQLHFFDSQAVPSLVTAAALPGQVIYLLETAQFDDEIRNLQIRFSAGEQFKLTYGELDRLFAVPEPGNGARLQSITVEEIQEPVAWILLAVGSALTALPLPRRVGPG